MQETAGAESQGLGARLLAAREQAGFTLVQAAQRLHLDVPTLQSIESERFSSLGASVFVRGHLRHYAELLGLPVAEIDAAYTACASQLAHMPDLRRVATPLDDPKASTSLSPRTAAIGAVVLVVAALIWWAARTPLQRVHATPSATTTVTPAVTNVPPTAAEPGALPPTPPEGLGSAPASPSSNP